MKTAPRASRKLNTLRLALLSILAGATAAALNSTAGADESEPRSVNVHYRDTDLARPGGMEALRHRIHWAAETVCDGSFTPELQLSPSYRRCVEEVTETALVEVNTRLAEVGSPAK